MRGLILSAALLTVLAGACSPPGAYQDEIAAGDDAVPADAPEMSAPVPPTPSQAMLPAPASLVGEYRVAGVDGEALDAPFGIALSIGDERISFDNCQQVGWTYSYGDGTLATRRAAIKASGDPGDPPPPCAAPLAPQVQRMADAIDSAELAVLTPENGIRLAGGGHSVTLFSQ